MVDLRHQNKKTIIMKTLSTPMMILLISLTFVFSTQKMYAQPANDLIVNAIDLGNGPVPYLENNVLFSTATNTNDNTPGLGCPVSQPGVWYRFTPTQAGEIAASIINPSNAVVVFYEGPAEGVTSGLQLTYVDQVENTCAYSATSSIEITLGTTYYLYLRNEIDSNVFINSVNIFGIPENDLIENAISLNDMEDYFESDIHFLMVSSTNDGGQIGGCDTQNTPGIWYKFTTEGDGQVVAGLSTAPNSCAIIFFSAENENATIGSDLTYVDQPSNPCDTGNLRSIEATANTTYYVFVGTSISHADFSINLSGILGTVENSIEGFNFYPNPTSNEIHLSALNTLDEVQFYNILGQIVYSDKIGATHRNVDISSFETGMYVMSVTSEGKTAHFKVIKR